MKLALVDVVRAAADAPEFGVRAGQIGTIVEVFGDAYEVEFCNDEGETIAMATLPEAMVELAQRQVA